MKARQFNNTAVNISFVPRPGTYVLGTRYNTISEVRKVSVTMFSGLISLMFTSETKLNEF